MNILYLVNYAGKGGSEKYIKIIAEMAKNRGNHIFFLYNENGNLVDEMESLGASLYKLEMNGPLDTKAAKILRNYCINNKIDIIHTQFARENMIAILSLSSRNKAKIIHTCHINTDNNFVWKTINKLFMNKNAHIIAVCESIKKRLIENNYPKQKVHVIHNGIAYKELKSRGTKIKEEYNINHFLFVTLTRFTPEKGNLFLLQSALKLKASTAEKFTILIAGDGPLLEECKNFANENNMADYTIFTGFRTDTEEILESGDCFINSSQSEASSFAIFEAMGKKLPIVATNVGGNPDIISKESNCGILVEYGDTAQMANAMETMLLNKETTKQLGENAYNAIKNKFNLEITLNKTYDLYRG